MAKCKRCGNELKKPWQKQYCSRECSNKATAGANSLSKMGEKNPMYGKRSPQFKGDTLSTDGYVVVTRGEKRVRKHREIMENHLGRKLEDWEVIHHKNENRLDNRIENLEVMRDGYHVRLHNKGRKYADQKEKEEYATPKA